MAFDSGRFLAEKFEPRTNSVPVPELKDWFDKGDKLVWKVKGLTGVEIAKADEYASKRSISTAILEGLLSMRAQDVKESIKMMVGQGDEIPEATAKRIGHLVAGSVDPVCDEDLAARLNKAFPTVFMNLTNQILILSGQGMTTPGKPKPFGKTKKSKQV